MVHFIESVSKDLTEEFGKAADGNYDLDMKDTLGKYSMDAVASCAFGVNAESFTNEKSLFVKHAKNVFRSVVDRIL